MNFSFGGGGPACGSPGTLREGSRACQRNDHRLLGLVKIDLGPAVPHEG